MIKNDRETSGNRITLKVEREEAAGGVLGRLTHDFMVLAESRITVGAEVDLPAAKLDEPSLTRGAEERLWKLDHWRNPPLEARWAGRFASQAPAGVTLCRGRSLPLISA